MDYQTVLAELRRAESRNGNGLVGVWVDWREYENDPRLFLPFLDSSARESRDNVAALINQTCGHYGIVAVVYRSSLAATTNQHDSAMWLRDELASVWDKPEIAGFRALLQGDTELAGVVLILARERFRGDGASVLYWGESPGQRRIALQDSEGVLPADLGKLVTQEHELQKQLGVLHCYLGRRWRAHGGKTDGSAKQLGDQLLSEFHSKSNRALLRRFSGLPQGHDDFTADERQKCCQILLADLSREPQPVPIRLEARSGSMLNWLACMSGDSPLGLARRFPAAFGNPQSDTVPEQGMASTLLSNLEPSDRAALKNDRALDASVQTILAIRAAYRWSNIFAHRDQYSRLMLSTATMASVIRHEVAYLQRLANTWRW
jgi:hypothetical protein